MSKLLEIPSHIKIVSKDTFEDVQESYDLSIAELSSYCKSKSSCVDAGKEVVFYNETNSDKMCYYGSSYIIFDYDNLFSVDGDCCCHLTSEELTLISKEDILKALNRKRG